MNKFLLCFDLDGTLLSNSRGEVCFADSQAINMFFRKYPDSKLVFATGRNPEELKTLGEVAPILQKYDALIARDGSELLGPNNLVLRKFPSFSVHDVRLIFREISKVFQTDSIFFVFHDSFAFRLSSNHLSSFAQRLLKKRPIYYSYGRLPYNDFYKVKVMNCPVSAQCISQLDNYGFSLYKIDGKDLQIMQNASNKFVALAFYCRLLDIPLDDVLYVGDDNNDLLALRNIPNSFTPLNSRLLTEKMVTDNIPFVLASSGGAGAVSEAIGLFQRRKNLL